MTLKTRRTLFYFLVFFFAVAATVVIFYSIGFRIDFENLSVTETGGIYVRSEPTEVVITLDGESIKNRSGLLNSGTLIDDLSPGDYSLSIDLDGYSSWRKDVLVSPGIVSVFDSIVLVSDNAREKIFDAVDEFRFANGLFITRTEDTVAFDGGPIIGSEIVYFTVGGSVLTQDQSSGDYYLSNILDLESSLNLSMIFTNLKESRLNLPGAVKIEKIVPYPFDDSRFILATERALYALNTEDLEIEQISDGVNAFFVADNEMFWTNDEGLYSYNLVFGNKSLISDELGREDDILNIGVPQGLLIVLTNSGSLIAVDRDSLYSTTTSEVARYFSLSPNKQFLMLEETNGAVYVYDLEEEEEEKRFVPLITLQEAHIDDIQWYRDNVHIFIKDNLGNLRFVEIDGSTPINEILISERVNNFVYDNEAESLYYGNDSGIWQLEI